MGEKDLCFYNWNLTKTFNHGKIEHIELPSNLLQKYRYLNFNNPSFYDLHLFTADPESGPFIQPFQIVPQNSLLSFEIPTEMSHNGIFILPIFNPNNSVKYENRAFIQFSQNNNGWDEKGKEDNNINLKACLTSTSTPIIENEKSTFYMSGNATDEINFSNQISLPGTNFTIVMISFYIPEPLKYNDINLSVGGLDFPNSTTYLQGGLNTFIATIKIPPSAVISFHDSNYTNNTITVENLKITVI